MKALELKPFLSTFRTSKFIRFQVRKFKEKQPKVTGQDV